MRLPFVSRRGVEQELAAVKADRERIRGERNQFERDRDAFKAAAETAARQFTDADTAVKRLSGRNKALADRLEAAQVAAGFDVQQAKTTANRLARLQKAVAKARTEAAQASGRARAAVSQELHRSEKARAALDEQLRVVQRSNEVQAAALLDAAVAVEEATS